MLLLVAFALVGAAVICAGVVLAAVIVGGQADRPRYVNQQDWHRVAVKRNRPAIIERAQADQRVTVLQRRQR